MVPDTRKCPACHQLISNTLKLNEDLQVTCFGACKNTYHMTCANIRKSEYNSIYANINIKWFCNECLQVVLSSNVEIENSEKINHLLKIVKNQEIIIGTLNQDIVNVKSELAKVNVNMDTLSKVISNENSKQNILISQQVESVTTLPAVSGDPAVSKIKLYADVATKMLKHQQETPLPRNCDSITADPTLYSVLKKSTLPSQPPSVPVLKLNEEFVFPKYSRQRSSKIDSGSNATMVSTMLTAVPEKTHELVTELSPSAELSDEEIQLLKMNIKNLALTANYWPTGKLLDTFYMHKCNLRSKFLKQTSNQEKMNK